MAVLQTVLTFALAVFPWLFPAWGLSAKIIFTLAVAFVSCVIYCISLALKLRSLRKKHGALEQNRNALAAQFDAKKDLILRYRRAFYNINLCVLLACQDTEAAKVKTIFEIVQSAQNQINDDGGI